MLKALIIDDDEPARIYLRAMLAAHPDVEIVGEGGTLPEARVLFARDNYDFVFLDVKLGNHTGFELMPDLLPGKPVIFVTGYEQHARHAFEVNALDYLVKPVRASRLAEALRRLGTGRANQSRAASPPARTLQLQLNDTVPLHTGDRAHFPRVADISLIEANENYSHVHLVDGRAVLVRRSLKSWADSLPASVFVRVHRTKLVNLAQVTGFERDTPRTIWLRIRGVQHPVTVSRFATPRIKHRLLLRSPAA